MDSQFTHFDDRGNAIMVDVSGKPDTVRSAAAVGRIRMSAECFYAISEGTVKKGDVLGVARLAGIMAVKNTPGLIPLCHALQIEKASIDFELLEKESAIAVCCTVKTSGKTGVEMEALTGAAVALLTIYDMCKAVDKSMIITEVFLREKTGGKSGYYSHSE